MRVELTLSAENDIRSILRNTLERFGEQQFRTYGRIVEAGIAMVAEEPNRPSSFDRTEIAEGVRYFHLELAARRRGSAAHALYYVAGALSDGSQGVIVLRVLHERAEPRRRVARVLALRGR